MQPIIVPSLISKDMRTLLHYLSSPALDDETGNAWLNSYKQRSLAERSVEAGLLLAILEQALTDLSNPPRTAQCTEMDPGQGGVGIDLI